MVKIELDEILIELTPCARDSDEIAIHVKALVNNKIFHKYEYIPLNDMESLYDTIWDYAGEELKKLILEEIK